MRLRACSVLLTLATSALLTISSAATAEIIDRSFCVFDPVGAKGPVFDAMRDYQAAALGWGVNFELRAYTSEAVVTADFNAGKCDAMGVTGTRVRPYNSFTASIEALGGVSDYQQLQTLIAMLAKPQASKYMKQGKYEVAGIMPGGAVYVFVRDKAINSVEAAAGKRIATLDYDQASLKVVEHIGATMVPSTVATFAPRFNNGDVDIAYAPAIAYQPFEMYKGLGEKGGIYQFSLAQMNFQLVVQADRFPQGFAQASRDYAFRHFDQAMEHIRQAESDIPQNYWQKLPPEMETDYKEMLRQIRVSLTNDGVYDPRMMKLMFRLRCRAEPGHYECAEKLEG
ncbi:putative solute-binding protein [Thalassolituus marinus]|uniref:putative solute-binding protein n=1 Tax=Thalassolituus marinus TaxID=671053 RepID=UPI001CE35BA7|nr:putative solute-binding protein [Thalassolituus marinus]